MVPLSPGEVFEQPARLRGRSWVSLCMGAPGRGELSLRQSRDLPHASPLLPSPCQRFYNYFYEFPQGNKMIKA